MRVEGGHATRTNKVGPQLRVEGGLPTREKGWALVASRGWTCNSDKQGWAQLQIEDGLATRINKVEPQLRVEGEPATKIKK